MRLFVSVDVPPWIKRVVHGIQHDLPDDGVTPVGTDNMHITLKFLGEVSPKKLPAVEQALRKVEHKRFEAVVKGVGAFPNEKFVRVVWAGCKTRELAELAGKIDAALPGFKGGPFVGHLTIARVNKRVEMRPFLHKYAEWRFGDFRPEKFYLMSSELSPKGPKYSVVAEFPLKE